MGNISKVLAVILIVVCIGSALMDFRKPEKLVEEMKKLKDLGFKKVRGTEPGFHMYELTPARLQAFDENFKPQAASDKPQATSRKQQALDKVK